MKRLVFLAFLILIAGCATVDPEQGDHKNTGTKKVYGGQHEHNHQGHG